MDDTTVNAIKALLQVYEEVELKKAAVSLVAAEVKVGKTDPQEIDIIGLAMEYYNRMASI